MAFYIVKPCKSTAAFEAIPQKQQRLDLNQLETELFKLGYRIHTNAGVILVVVKNGSEISIYPTGKLLLKVESESTAKKIVNDLEDILF